MGGPLNFSRRDLRFLLPALAAAGSKAQTPPMLSSKTYRFEDLVTKTNANTKSTAVLEGKTHTGFAIQVHETEVFPGQMPHPPHHHEHEEVTMVREGSLEVTIAGKVSHAGPGSVIFVGSNDEHGWKNIGTTRRDTS